MNPLACLLFRTRQPASLTEPQNTRRPVNKSLFHREGCEGRPNCTAKNDDTRNRQLLSERERIMRLAPDGREAISWRARTMVNVVPVASCAAYLSWPTRWSAKYIKLADWTKNSVNLTSQGCAWRAIRRIGSSRRSLRHAVSTNRGNRNAHIIDRWAGLPNATIERRVRNEAANPLQMGPRPQLPGISRGPLSCVCQGCLLHQSQNILTFTLETRVGRLPPQCRFDVVQRTRERPNLRLNAGPQS